MSRHEDDLRFAEWVQEARDVPTIVAAERWFGFKASNPRNPRERNSACPACGGSITGKLKADRFRIYIGGPKRGGFACRKCNITGGDAIALLMKGRGDTFLEAVEELTGRACPAGRDERSEEAKADARAKIEAAKEADRKRQEEAAAEAAREIEERAGWAADLWRRCLRFEGSPAQGYMEQRHVTHWAAAPDYDGVNLAHAGFIPSLKLKNDARRVLHDGPAMVWQVVNARGVLRAVHRTWVDPEQFGNPATKGRPLVLDPDTGEAVGTKKTLGDKSGNAIRFVRGLGSQGEPPQRLFLAEGLETLGAMRAAMIAARHHRLHRAAFWSACDLGNIGAIRLPEVFDEVILLGDGDCDARTVEHFFLEHMKLNNRPGRVFVPCFARPGQDFSDMWGMAA